MWHQPEIVKRSRYLFIQQFVVLELELGWNWVGIGLELAVIGPLETI